MKSPGHEENSCGNSFERPRVATERVEIDSDNRNMMDKIIDSVEPINETYFEYHKGRFKYCANKISDGVPKGGEIMDIGSHYLDQSVILSKMGYNVWGFDLPTFSEDKEVKERAKKNDVKLVTIENLEQGKYRQKIPNEKFDAVVMSEVLEHITFNPVIMWEKLLEKLKKESKIFVSTPNSLRLENACKELAKIISGRGIGISVDGILNTVTTGHHWKEYSIHEIKNYFEKLGFEKNDVKVETYRYRNKNRKDNVKETAYEIISKFGNLFKKFREEMFVTVEVKKEEVEIMESPSYK